MAPTWAVPGLLLLLRIDHLNPHWLAAKYNATTFFGMSGIIMLLHGQVNAVAFRLCSVQPISKRFFLIELKI